MNLSWTLSRYLGWHFLMNVGIVFGMCVTLGFVIDIVELLNRTAGREAVAFSNVVRMALLKLPNLTEKMMPFAILFGAIWNFARLTRSQELVIARASGVSAWLFLAPAIVVALLIGIFMTTIYNPFAAQLVSRYEELEARYIRGRSSLLAVNANGLWLRQGDEKGQTVIHALHVSDSGLKLQDVIMFIYEGKDQFRGRIDAKTAALAKDKWQLERAWVTGPDRPAVFYPTLDVKTSLTPNQIQESFATPDTIAFWDLPQFIAQAEAAGFSATRHRLHYHALLAGPLLLCAMIFVAAAFSLRLARLGGAARLILSGVLTGFLLYFFTDVTHALGISGIVPVALAAWAPATTALLLGMASLFNQEDG
jgi:lipopolysaccharide export system permease protein